ncbi:acyltransferase domain-containing protein [Amycolatopsis sp. NEAU-NG30]|uniref:Acyltransferase domain-containing protein n=1 Tax=Amycolatopsis melonis TaxID=3156488 RepID=A0ABV0L736_9PSEU
MKTDIAVVGMAARLAGGIGSLPQFWQLLAEGGELVSPLPEDRWAEYTGIPGNEAVLRGTVRHGSFMDSITGFDAGFFGISPREAEHMDPQQRILLEVTWEALEHAGIPPSSLAGTDTGVYIGAVSNDYERRSLEDLPGIEAWSGIGTQMCGQANRISHVLDLRGPSLALDTACSASLVATHLAVRALAQGEVPVAIVGGVNVVAGPGLTVMLDAAGALAPDGRCKSFDAAADGYGRGEGCGVIVLKRLSDAQRDGDRVLAVIAGTAVHQDGRTNGIMAPSTAAQAHLLRTAYGAAGIDPSTVDYVEAHGTGTPAGDPVEVAALAEVLGGRRPLLVGSVKPNIGHLEAGAGVVSLIKTVLAMRHGTIPATVLCTGPSPDIPWGDRVRLVTEPTPWPSTGRPRRAGVSSYGYGGTLAHVILEQAPEVRCTGSERIPRVEADPASHLPVPRVFPLSGATEPALRANAARLADAIATDPLSLPDLAHTLTTRRTQLPVRAAVVARDRDHLLRCLREIADGTGQPVTARPDAAAPVWVFSGHGAQWAGMGRDLLDAEPVFAAALDAIAPVFRAELGFTPREALQSDPMTAVDVVQPMIFAVQLGLAAVWRRYGVEPAAVIGHSVGEIAAAVVTGALTPAEGARLICRRSRLLRRVAGQGAMAMVNLSFADAERLLADTPDLTAAISAAPGWTVVAGPAAAVQWWQPEGVVVRRVASDVAFHSPAMDPLLAELAAVELAPVPPAIPLYTTALTDPRSAPVLDGAYWAANLRNPVRFAEAVEAAAQDGHRVFVEVSAHPVVAHSVADTLAAAGITDTCVTGTLRRGTPDHEQFLTALATLHCHGVPVDLAAANPGGEQADLPHYAWQHRDYWRASSVTAGIAARTHDVSGHTLLGELTTVAGDVPIRLWQTRLDYDSRPYPGTHPVFGVEIVPAAVLLTTFLDAAGTAVADVVLRSPISLAARREVQVSERTGELRLASRPVGSAHDEWQTHTTARTAAPEAPEALDISALRAECAEPLPAGFVHDLLAVLDVPAMGFPWRVGELHRRAGVALLAIVDTGSWGSALDAALSLPTAVFPGDPALRMPAAIGSVRLFAETPGRVLIAVRLTGPETVDVTVADLDGRVLATLSAARFARPDGGRPAADRTAEPSSVSPVWTELDPRQLREYLVGEVRAQVAAEIRLPADELNVRRPLAELGVDSVMTLAVRTRLEKIFGIALPATLLWNHPTVAAVADYLAGELA